MLGSATPSLESYSRAKAGEIALCGLPERVDGRGLPEMVVVDRRDEIKAGNYSFLSREGSRRRWTRPLSRAEG